MVHLVEWDKALHSASESHSCSVQPHQWVTNDFHKAKFIFSLSCYFLLFRGLILQVAEHLLGGSLQTHACRFQWELKAFEYLVGSTLLLAESGCRWVGEQGASFYEGRLSCSSPSDSKCTVSESPFFLQDAFAWGDDCKHFAILGAVSIPCLVNYLMAVHCLILVSVGQQSAHFLIMVQDVAWLLEAILLSAISKRKSRALLNTLYSVKRFSINTGARGCCVGSNKKPVHLGEVM